MPLPDRLEDMTNPQLRNLLKLEDLPRTGKKSVLIARLGEYSGKPKPDVDWQYSDAKKELKAELLNPNSLLHMMTVDEIWNSRA
jgi:hypothetical protein